MAQKNSSASRIYYINERNHPMCKVTAEQAEKEKAALAICVERMKKKWERVTVQIAGVSCGCGEQARVYGEGRK